MTSFPGNTVVRANSWSLQVPFAASDAGFVVSFPLWGSLGLGNVPVIHDGWCARTLSDLAATSEPFSEFPLPLLSPACLLFPRLYHQPQHKVAKDMRTKLAQ